MKSITETSFKNQKQDQIPDEKFKFLSELLGQFMNELIIQKKNVA